MGRKIPAKKHRGVKDPIQQQARRFQSLKNKINAPPVDPDEQPVPRSLTRLFAFQNKTPKLKEKVKTLNRDSVKSKTENPVSELRRLPGESGRGFSLRINSAVRALHDHSSQEHYPEDMDADDVKGARMAAQRQRRARRGKRSGQGEGETLTRTQRLALKKKEKKMKAIQEKEAERCEVQYERVAFGEVAHAPPSAGKPGRRRLLLTDMLRGGAGGGAGGAGGVRRAGGAGGAVDKEEARLAAVAAQSVAAKTSLGHSQFCTKRYNIAGQWKSKQVTRC